MAQPGQQGPRRTTLTSQAWQNATPSATKALHPAQRAGQSTETMRSQNTTNYRICGPKSCFEPNRSQLGEARSDRVL